MADGRFGSCLMVVLGLGLVAFSWPWGGFLATRRHLAPHATRLLRVHLAYNGAMLACAPFAFATGRGLLGFALLVSALALTFLLGPLTDGRLGARR